MSYHFNIVTSILIRQRGWALDTYFTVHIFHTLDYTVTIVQADLKHAGLCHLTLHLPSLLSIIAVVPCIGSHGDIHSSSWANGTQDIWHQPSRSVQCGQKDWKGKLINQVFIVLTNVVRTPSHLVTSAILYYFSSSDSLHSSVLGYPPLERL